MKLLIDTHTLIWYYQTDPKMSQIALSLIQDPANSIHLSAASHWEIAIKMSTGKLKLAQSFPDFVQGAIVNNGIAIVPILPIHTAELVGLPQHHRDPFDRLLVAQAMVENMPIISADSILDPYSIRRLW